MTSSDHILGAMVPDRPLGAKLVDWTPPAFPDGRDLVGRTCRLRVLQPEVDGPALFDLVKTAPWVWDYLFEEPPQTPGALTTQLDAMTAVPTSVGYAICRGETDTALGYSCLMSIAPDMGSTEIGNVMLSPDLQRTPTATEAFSLMLRFAFAEGYRRVVWKCNALNAPSHKAARRLGFTYEGMFRNHYVVKGNNRDTAWFAIIAEDWPAIAKAHATWLSSDNFDDQGRQRQSLSNLTALLISS
jgi:RimJ/RimL family protein N-acetyltransferase